MANQKIKNFTMLPNSVVRGAHGIANLAVLLAIKSRGTCTASAKTIAKDVGCSRNTVFKAIKYWKDHGQDVGVSIELGEASKRSHITSKHVTFAIPNPPPTQRVQSVGSTKTGTPPPYQNEYTPSTSFGTVRITVEEVVSTPPKGGAQTTGTERMLAPGLSRGLGAPAGAAYQGKEKETDKDPETEAYVEYGSADVSPMAKRAQSMVRDFMKELDKDPGAEWKKNWLSWVRLASDHPALLTDKEKEQIRGLFRKIKDGYEARDVFAIIRKRILKMNH